MRRRLVVFGLPFALLPLALGGRASQGGERSLLTDARFKPSSEEVTATPRNGLSAQGVEVRVAPGKDGYPGVGFAPSSGAWDLSKHGHVSARIVNTGEKPLTVALRVDNEGLWQDNPWNTESVTLAPGEAGTATTIFGYQYDRKPGYKLDPSRVTGVLVFSTKAEGPLSYRIESLVAGGPAGEKPPVSPDDVRVKPAKGVLLEPGTAGLRFEGDAASLSGGSTADRFVSFRTSAGVVRIVPSAGRWDLRDATQVRVTLRNDGYTAVRPRVRVESNGGDSAWVSPPKPIPSRGKVDLVVPFGRRVDLNDPATLVGVTSDAVRAVAISTEGGGNLNVLAARAESPSAAIPAWLGKRPPVAGAWTKTLSEEFSGSKLDGSVWKATGENYYDKTSHWSKANAIVGGGVARLRFEKKTGFQNDDPSRVRTPYATGYLDTFGLWKQRYGYFEARMKLPKAPGLWPAFWMMPDRGSAAGPEQWKRQFTGDGAMEFDIMETLTRWGPRRTNIAMHYDGYEKEHRALGSEKIYFETDKDGFATFGLLWTPGLAVYYANGREVLRWANPRVSNVPSILMFTLPTGGWDNDAMDDAQLPADFVIDYVRVWQRKDLASPVDGKRKDPQT